MTYPIVLLTHLLAATVWTGGHLVLACTILPGVLKNRSPSSLLDFEQRYEKIGMPSLLLLVVTGLFMAHTRLPDPSTWFNLDDPTARHISIKLTLLLLTALLAVHARFRLIPNLTEETLPIMAWHIVGVTILSVLFVVTGLSFRMQFF